MDKVKYETNEMSFYNTSTRTKKLIDDLENSTYTSDTSLYDKQADSWFGEKTTGFFSTHKYLIGYTMIGIGTAALFAGGYLVYVHSLPK